MNFLPDVEVVCPVCHGRRYQKEVLGVKYNGLSISGLFDEPTVGLHPQDVERLIGVFDRLVMKGNSVVVIEHNQSVLRAADWLIDLGPEGGKRGGCIMAQGKPEEII